MINQEQFILQLNGCMVFLVVFIIGLLSAIYNYYRNNNNRLL